jgi:hypothetical protein
LRPGGTLSGRGVYSGKLQIPYEAFAAGLGDQRIVTTLCSGGKERMRLLMEVVKSGRVDFTPLLTHTFPLDRIGEAYDLFGERLDGGNQALANPLVCSSRRFQFRPGRNNRIEVSESQSMPQRAIKFAHIDDSPKGTIYFSFANGGEIVCHDNRIHQDSGFSSLAGIPRQRYATRMTGSCHVAGDHGDDVL